MTSNKQGFVSKFFSELEIGIDMTLGLLLYEVARLVKTGKVVNLLQKVDILVGWII